jgi:hypothetical protein
MHFLRDRWHRTAFHQFLVGMEPIDRATFWIASALALAVGLSFSAIVHS